MLKQTHIYFKFKIQYVLDESEDGAITVIMKRKVTIYRRSLGGS